MFDLLYVPVVWSHNLASWSFQPTQTNTSQSMMSYIRVGKDLISRQSDSTLDEPGLDTYTLESDQEVELKPLKRP